MNSARYFAVVSLFLFTLATSAMAQERWQRLPVTRDVQFYAARNKLEEFESRQSVLLVKGRHWVATLRTGGGNARVEATEIRDRSNASRATGVTVTIVTGNPQNEVRCLIDYDELESLLAAFDVMAKADDTSTKLSHFEAHYRTRADLEIIVFKQLTGGIAAAVEGGFIDRSRVLLTLEEFTRLRWMIAQAKEKLDEIN
jgi:hypothetical protein